MSLFAEPPVPEFMAFLMFAFGASIGSFLNVVAYRVPLGMSIIRPASRCPHCETPIRSFDNVPVLGWLWLRGKCRACRGPISPRYPLVEFLLGAVFFVLAWVEWPMGGVNLPGADLDQMQRYGVFAYHALLIVGLLALALVEFDGKSITKVGVLLSLLGVVLGAPWLFLHPVSPPFTLMRTEELVQEKMLGFVDGLTGWVVGIVIGCLAAIATDRGPSGLQGRQTAIVALAAVGAFLGWQAVAALGAVTTAVFALVVMYRAAWRRLSGVPFSGVLFVATVAWLLNWRNITTEYPVVGFEANHLTLAVAGGVVVVASLVAWGFTRRAVVSSS